MSMARTPHVKHGGYTDCQEGWQWLLTTSWANVMTNALGIAVTIAAARLFRILSRVAVRIHRARHPLPPANPQTASQGGHSPLHIAQHNPAPESFGWHSILQVLEDIYRLPSTITLSTQTPSSRRCTNSNLGLLFAGLLALGFYAAAQIAGIFTARLQTTNIALSEHPDCGVYWWNIESGPEVVRKTDPYEFNLQEASGLWAKTCYGANGTPDGCNKFITKEILYHTQNVSCPWPGGMCHESGQSAVHFSSGAVDARNLGVNSPTKLEFNRTTTCAPLNMNSTFIPPYHKENSDLPLYTFRYYYGPTKALGNASWFPQRWPMYSDTPTYLVSGVTYNPRESKNDWIPLPQLEPDTGSTLTLMFVAPERIYHTVPSYDPVFPAWNKTIVSGREYYMNLLGQGTVMGCVDTTLWRYPSYGETWKRVEEVYDTMPDSSHDRGAHNFFRNAIVSSSTFTAFSRRLAASLIAQSRVVGFVSLPLAEEQWKVEAEQLFKTSLARMQFDAHNIARGLMKQPGWVKRNYTDEICHQTYLFHVDGWSNVTPFWSKFIFVTTAFLVFLALPMSDETLLPEWLWSNSHLIGQGVMAIAEWIGASWTNLTDAISDCVGKCYH